MTFGAKPMQDRTPTPYLRAAASNKGIIIIGVRDKRSSRGIIDSSQTSYSKNLL